MYKYQGSAMDKIAGFDWDDGNREKCGKHGVSIAEIESVFGGSVAVYPDPVHSKDEERFIAIGRPASGRMVFAAFTLREHEGKRLIRPISVRYMHKKEIEHYEKEAAKAAER
jgi:uncharacterized DUF497 family protein